jgi:ABC-type multidrug transport system fused ATPase/permease subunit
MAAPTAQPDGNFSPNTQLQGAENTQHVNPAAESNTLDATDSDNDINLQKKGHDREAIEEAESPIEGDFKNELRPSNLDRTQSNFTTTTGTSVTSSQPANQLELPPVKQTWSQKLNPLRRKNPPPVPDQRQVSREYDAGFFSLVTFQWMASFMDVGYQRPLVDNDIWAVNPKRSIDSQKERMGENYKRRKEAKHKRPLAMALYDTYRGEFIFGGACQLIASLAQILTPFVMKYLIQFSSQAYYANRGLGVAPPIGEGIGLVFGITLMQMLMSLTTNHFIYRGMMVGGQARSTLISLIFDKAMRLSGRARAGGAAETAAEETPQFEPGSKEEKKWLKKKLADAQNGISGEGVGWSNGRIVNLMSTDTYRVDQASGLFHMIWTAPIQVVLTLILLLINITYSALSGFAFIVIMMPLLGQAIKSLMFRRRFINKVTDQRVTLTQEIISSVRFVKFFGWETSFLDRLASLRKQEVDKITKLLSIRNAILAVSLSLPIFASMLAFITYSLSGNGLAPAPIFSSLALFNSLRIPLNLLPMVIGQIVDANASIKRIQEFLDAEELPVEATWEEKAHDAIEIENGSFTWERTRTQDTDDTPIKGDKPGKPTKQEKKDAKQEKKHAKIKQKEDKRIAKQREAEKLESDPSSPTDDDNSMQEKEKRPFEISGINLSIGRDELVAVIGSVGSGKSSLLAALAGDMRKTSGNVTFGASRAFCPQYAWIQNASVKENITFSKPYDRHWYNQVVDACALRPDLEMLPAGDLTEIGERGITVSGGQKQRLNIARAIYFNADIVIMDDPLSAVDAHVGKHIMDEAICGLLKGKARVLATHQLHVLHRADRIVWMKEGRIAKIATFPELMEHDEEFQKLMETTAAEEEEEEVEEVLEDKGEKEKKAAVKKTKKTKKSAAALMQQEERAVNSVSSSVYMAYVKASGSIAVLPFILLLLISSQGSNIVTSLWLSWWTSNKFNLSEGVYIGVYAAFGVLQALLTFAFATTLTYFGTKASRVMLQRAIYRVLRAPMSFFDTTPMGRITNRFSKDVDTMDNVLTDSIRMFTLTFVTIISVFILIIAYYYYFVVALVPLTFMFCFSAGYYRASARELKRHEANLRSVVFARFSEAVNGTSTIRAYGVEKQFAHRLSESLDSMDGAYFLTFANQRWLSVRLDALGNLLVFTCGILVVTARFSIDPSTGGLVLSYILSIVQMIQFSVRQLAEVENNMNSTERIHYYGTQLEEEAPLKRGEVRSSWPERGEIVFEDVQMRYRAGLPLVLKGMSMTVKAGERIGIVGRTGAGKSTIMSTLFRLVELSGGRITIDGLDISTLGLADLRSRLAIIPQDPTLFRGTIRSNLDPFHEHTDLELWNALRQADLVGPEQALENPSPSSPSQDGTVVVANNNNNNNNTSRIHLDTPVEDEGLNFSLGQRQLLALARALVRNSQIIVCDEATSSVDFETDQKIQRTIVRGFSGKTLLCIAHRLRTIIGYDRILVMDQGNVAELDSPLRLFEKEGGIFRGMCERSGIRREDFLGAGREVRDAMR